MSSVRYGALDDTVLPGDVSPGPAGVFRPPTRLRRPHSHVAGWHRVAVCPALRPGRRSPGRIRLSIRRRRTLVLKPETPQAPIGGRSRRRHPEASRVSVGCQRSSKRQIVELVLSLA